MKISIITASFNSADTILDAIESVQSQDYPDKEHILIDGNSSDGTLSLIQDLNQKPDYFVSEPDEGVYDALNKGFERASGDIIGILHSDDLFGSADLLSRVAAVFNESKCDMLYGDLLYISKNRSSRIIRNWTAGSFYHHLLRKGWMAPHPTIFIKREVFEKHGGFDTRYRISADYDFILRIFSDHSLKIKYLPEVMVKMLTGGKSNRSLVNIFRKSYEDYRIISYHRIGSPLLVLMRKNFSKISQFIHHN